MMVQWTGENLADVQRVLSYHSVHIAKDGLTLHLTGPAGLNVSVELGETIEIRLGRGGIFDGIGIHWNPREEAPPEVVWTGENVRAIAAFVEPHGLMPRVVGSQLTLEGEGLAPVTMYRGDKLIVQQSRFLCMSRAGKDHRA